MTEKDIENSILEYLSLLPKGIFWKIDVGGIYDPAKKIFRKRQSKFRKNGVSDIIGFYKNRFIAIEVKTPKRRNAVSRSQLEFLEATAQNGGVAIVATSAKEVADILVKL